LSFNFGFEKKNLRLEIKEMQKKWQENRNYRRFKNENGEIVRRVITVDGVDVEVSEEVFLAYSQADRRERYIKESERGKVVSLDRLLADGAPLQKLGIEPIESAEDATIAFEDELEFARLLSLLPEALIELRDEDRKLIEALYIKGVSAREYARQHNVYHRAVIYRRDRVLEKLRNRLEKNN